MQNPRTKDIILIIKYSRIFDTSIRYIIVIIMWDIRSIGKKISIFIKRTASI